MFETLALLGGFWFFVFVILVLGIGIVSSEFDSTIGGIITLVLLFSGLYLFGYFPIQTAISTPLAILVISILYITVGFAYAILYRYPNYLNDHQDIIQDKWQNFLKESGENSTREDFYNNYRYCEFLPSQNVDRISAWITLWPWGVFWDLSHKPFRWTYRKLYHLAGNMLDSVSKRVFNRIIDKVDRK